MTYTIADLHCDLLCYLAGDVTRTPYDIAVRCSIPQLREGGVKLQVLPIYTSTEPGSVASGQAQIAAFNKLLHEHSDQFACYLPGRNLSQTSRIQTMLAIENASSLISEDEPLDHGLERLQHLFNQQEKVAYLSFTWNAENRFGGGAHTSVGLKSDGKILLHFLAGKSVAVDLSHTSDKLAYDILDEINRRNLDIPVIASHSNARVVADAARNLPDELIKEVIARCGVIGLNFVRPFVGEEPISGFRRHLDHFLSLGAHDSLCFGADFFYGNDVPIAHRKSPEELFFSGFDHSGCYLRVIELWKERSGIDERTLCKILSKNLIHFLESKIYVASREASV